ncbi:uncharacterized protein LOC126833127 [Adelges cooleyi]|uniref:uncharacterized protein LOC126833127 n=1 Tax=Adelges cooleyi TaxID=133065 RepID=UPI00217FCB40|nr:uncharacterized protein LOC126833127 [Adelges cooleyi]
MYQYIPSIKRSKSIDFDLTLLQSDIAHGGFKTSKSCPNLKKIHVPLEQRNDDLEWKELLKSLIDTWVQKKDTQIQNIELQTLCLEDLLSHYSEQMQKTLKKHRALTSDVHDKTEELRSLVQAVAVEKQSQIDLKEKLGRLELEYQNKSHILEQQITTNKELESEKQQWVEKLSSSERLWDSDFKRITAVNQEIKTTFSSDIVNYKLANGHLIDVRNCLDISIAKKIAINQEYMSMMRKIIEYQEATQMRKMIKKSIYAGSLMFLDELIRFLSF